MKLNFHYSKFYKFNIFLNFGLLIFFAFLIINLSYITLTFYFLLKKMYIKLIDILQK